MWMEFNSSLLTYTTAYKLIVSSLAFSAIAFFPKLLRRETNMAVSYQIVATLLAMLLCHSLLPGAQYVTQVSLNYKLAYILELVYIYTHLTAG